MSLKFNQVSESFVQKYERYLPTAFDESMTLLQKVNKLNEHLNEIVRNYNEFGGIIEKEINDHLTHVNEALKAQDLTIEEIIKDVNDFKELVESQLLPHNLEITLDGWFSSGKLGQIINDEVFDMKANTTDLVNTKKRNQQLLRLKNVGDIKRYVLPVGFTWQSAPIRVYSDGAKFYTSFDVSDFKNVSSKTIFWSVNGSNVNDGLTEGTPVKSLYKAAQLCNAGDTILNIDPSGTIVDRLDLFNGNKITKSLNIIARNPIYCPLSSPMTYTKTAGTGYLYQTTRTNAKRVVDISYSDYGMQYKKVLSVTECESTPASWYTDGTNVYIHTMDGKAPNNSKLFLLLDGECVHVKSDVENVKLYMENLKWYGGNIGSAMFDRTNFEIEVYAKGCYFLHSKGVDFKANAVNCFGTKYAYFQDCVAGYSDKDGFNYTPYNVLQEKKEIPYFIEVNCKGFMNGIENIISVNVNNGSTAHSGVKGIRVNGEYYKNMGGNVVDVHPDTQTINLGVIAYDGLVQVDSEYNTNFSAQQSGVEMWLDGCIAFGNKYDMVVANGATMHIDNSQYDRLYTVGLTTTNNNY